MFRHSNIPLNQMTCQVEMASHCNIYSNGSKCKTSQLNNKSKHLTGIITGIDHYRLITCSAVLIAWRKLNRRPTVDIVLPDSHLHGLIISSLSSTNTLAAVVLALVTQTQIGPHFCNYRYFINLLINLQESKATSSYIITAA